MYFIETNRKQSQNTPLEMINFWNAINLRFFHNQLTFGNTKIAKNAAKSMDFKVKFGVEGVFPN